MFGVVAAGPARAGFPSLYVGYNTADCTFRLTNDAGNAVGTIAPGVYQVVISTQDPYGSFDQSGRTDLMACKGFVKFRLTGPGVSLFTTLDYGDSAGEQYTETFRAGGTYTLQDDTNVAGTRRSFAVATSGSATPTATTPTAGAQQDVVPSAANPLRGALDAVVTAAGKVSLRRLGKPVFSLKAGRWTFAVHDVSKTAGFVVRGLHQKPVTVTNGSFVGWRELTLTLDAGRWSFYSPGGKESSFKVAR